MKPTKLSILNFQGSRKRAQRKFTYWLCSECSRSSTTKLLISFALAVVMLLGACGDRNTVPTSFIVEGILPDSSCHGKQINLQRYSDGKSLGVTTVEGDRFIFTGVADTAEFCRIDVSESLYNNLILENGRIYVPMVHTRKEQEQPFATGSKGNESYAEIMTLNKKFRVDYVRIIDSLRALYPDAEEFSKALEPHYQTYLQTIKEKSKELFDAHRDDAISYTLFSTRFYQTLELEEQFAVIDALDPHVKSSPFVQNEWEKLNSEKEERIQFEKTGAGKQFVDFNGKDINGRPSKLSDYVGKGNYVLVDFWASWCGPCRGEIPNLKQLYKKYNGKGFTILGIYVWDIAENMKTALREEQITWPQLFDSEKTATQLYGVGGIPHIMLFGPDGTILERGLRGENMIKTVGEYLEAEQQ